MIAYYSKTSFSCTSPYNKGDEAWNQLINVSYIIMHLAVANLITGAENLLSMNIFFYNYNYAHRCGRINYRCMESPEYCLI